MKPFVFLRIAAVLTLLYCVGHSSGFPWTPVLGPGEAPVIEAMKAHSFDVNGSTRTYWDFYVGFGIIIGLLLLAQAVVFWQLAALAKTDALRVRPIVASFFVAFIVNAFLGWKYFFSIPVIMSIAIAISLAFAFVMAGRSKVA